MNREIKFRAWDKKNEEMVNDIWIAPEYDWAVMSDGDNMCERERPERGQWELMQFTGLLDKNGVEIYEGDIIEFKDFDDSFFDGKRYVAREVCWQDYFGAGWSFGTAWKDGEKRWSFDFPAGCKIIGNKWESPELLKGES